MGLKAQSYGPIVMGIRCCKHAIKLNYGTLEVRSTEPVGARSGAGRLMRCSPQRLQPFKTEGCVSRWGEGLTGKGTSFDEL